MTIALQPIVPLDLIQGIRLTHALMESKFEICVPKESASIFEHIKRQFGTSFQITSGEEQKLDVFKIDHCLPQTSIGSITRPLIFPHAIIQHGRGLWPLHRKLRLSFMGLIPRNRHEVLSSYCLKNFGSKTLPNLNPLHHRAANRIRRHLGIREQGYFVKIKEFTLGSSPFGRSFPQKAWHSEYFNVLANSQFVLCPNGDYVWSYRFYESALCGAIPIVEESCDAYSDFICYSMEDRFDSLAWDPATAAHNFRVCMDRISVPLEQINKEIESLL